MNKDETTEDINNFITFLVCYGLSKAMFAHLLHGRRSKITGNPITLSIYTSAYNTLHEKLDGD